MQHQLILVSAGESEWLPLNLFTGWSDVLLSERGMEQARAAGHLLKKEGILLDRAYTSYLRRGIRTCSLILQQLHEEYIPVTKAWQLNERHYGALQELSKIDTARSYGNDRVADWRRAYDVKPPEVDADDENPSRTWRDGCGATIRARSHQRCSPGRRSLLQGTPPASGPCCSTLTAFRMRRHRGWRSRPRFRMYTRSTRRAGPSTKRSCRPKRKRKFKEERT